jgi:hypothetical protein
MWRKCGEGLIVRRFYVGTIVGGRPATGERGASPFCAPGPAWCRLRRCKSKSWLEPLTFGPWSSPQQRRQHSAPLFGSARGGRSTSARSIKPRSIICRAVACATFGAWRRTKPSPQRPPVGIGDPRPRKFGRRPPEVRWAVWPSTDLARISPRRGREDWQHSGGAFL